LGRSNSAATLNTSAVAIAPSHHRRLRVRNVNIPARMPQPDRGLAVGRLTGPYHVRELRYATRRGKRNRLHQTHRA
jgi:hypothetical protein